MFLYEQKIKRNRKIGKKKKEEEDKGKR